MSVLPFIIDVRISENRLPHSLSFPVPAYGPFKSVEAVKGLIQFFILLLVEFVYVPKSALLCPSCLTIPPTSRTNHSSSIWLFLRDSLQSPGSEFFTSRFSKTTFTKVSCCRKYSEKITCLFLESLTK